MNFFIATVGELVIVELCVLWIWVKVLIDTLQHSSQTLDHRRLLMTSLGLVFNALAIAGIMIFRLLEYTNNGVPYGNFVLGCYVVLALGNIMFIVCAAIGSKNAKTFKSFLLATLLWTMFCIITYFSGLEFEL